jgi:hypothetical protein
MNVLPRYPILHIGVTELVGKDEQVDQNELGDAVEVDLSSDGEGQPISGEILSAMFYATEEGSGSVQDSAGELLIFTADPGQAAGDDGSGISGAEWQTCIGRIKIAASDWSTEDNGGIAYVTDTPIPFHDLSSLFLVWYHTDATSLNDAAGDDEVLDVDLWYQRYS